MSVFLGYLHPNDLSASFHKSLLDLVHHDAANGRHLGTYGAVRSAGYGLPEARNYIASAAIASKADWLLFIDADMGFTPDVIERLVEVADPVERPIVGGLCFVWKDRGPDGFNGVASEPAPTLYDWIEGDFRSRAHYPANTLVPVAATGTALLLIHRSVLTRVADEYGPHWFDRLPRQNAEGLMGEDISFFMRTGSLQIPAFVHTGIRTTHHKEIFVAESDWWNSFVAPPATEEVDVIVPTVRERVGNIRTLAETLRASTGLARLVLVVDDEEHALEVKEFGDTVICPGKFPVKVNAGFAASSAPWVKVVGDDVRFRPGWLDHAQLVARLYSAKVVGSNDLANPRVMAGDHATHWMVSREYVESEGASWDGPGVLCHEGYRHWFTDDEIVTVAKQRGVFQASLASIVEHFHPLVGKAESDDVYERNDRYASQDRDLFRKRLAANAS